MTTDVPLVRVSISIGCCVFCFSITFSVNFALPLHAKYERTTWYRPQSRTRSCDIVLVAVILAVPCSNFVVFDSQTAVRRETFTFHGNKDAILASLSALPTTCCLVF